MSTFMVTACLSPKVMVSNALMVRCVSAKVGQGIFLMFLHLLALRNGSSESLDAGHVRYPFRFTVVVVSSEAVVADIETRQCPVILDAISKRNNTYK